MKTAFYKEWLEQRRTHRLLIVCVVFFAFGLSSPLIARFMPEMFALIPGAEMLAGLIPEPGVVDAVSQYLKNLTQFGLLLAVLMGMTMVSGEKDKGTAAVVLAKPFSRTAFILAKSAALGVSFFIGTLLAAAAGWYYTSLLFEPMPAGGWIAMNALLFVYFSLYASLTLLASTLCRSTLASGGTAFGFIIVLALVEVIPAVRDHLTGGLLEWAAKLAMGLEGSAWGALGVCLGLIVMALAASVLIFHRQEI